MNPVKAREEFDAIKEIYEQNGVKVFLLMKWEKTVLTGFIVEIKY